MSERTKVKTGKVRLSYAHLFEKYDFNGASTPKYSVALLIPKEDTATLEKLENAYDAALEEGIDKNGKAFANAKNNAPFIRPQGGSYGLLVDGEYKDAPGFYILNLKSETAPGVLALETGKTKLTKENGGPDIVYSGCYAKATLNVFPFTTPKAGISASLNNILKIEDGEKFGGIADANDDFADELQNLVDNIEDLI